MQTVKTALSIIAIGLIFYAYIPYLRDVVRHKTIPHTYSWFIWALVTAIAFGVQITHDGGFGSFITLGAAIACTVIFAFAVKIGDKDITVSDKVCLALGLIAIALWVFAKQPFASVTLATLIDLIGFIPSIRKSWSRPYQETLQSWVINVIRYTLSVIALSKYSYLTLCYPLVLVLANAIFCVLIIERRKRVPATI